MQQLNLIQQVAIWALPVLFAITIHEVAHGWVAKQLGDPTAMMLGRLTLNPLKHIDPVGTVLVPLSLIVLSYFTSGGFFIFGWAKPVPIAADNLHHPKRDMALVAAAGPLSNLTMALIWALIIKLALLLPSSLVNLALPLTYMGGAGITINVLLMVLNLIPVPPLDGSRVVAGFLPDPLAWKFGRLEQYGLIILLLMMVSGILGKIMWPPVAMVQNMIYRMFGL
jgi:Zn-dependent protease